MSAQHYVRNVDPVLDIAVDNHTALLKEEKDKKIKFFELITKRAEAITENNKNRVNRMTKDAKILQSEINTLIQKMNDILNKEILPKASHYPEKVQELLQIV